MHLLGGISFVGEANFQLIWICALCVLQLRHCSNYQRSRVVVGEMSGLRRVWLFATVKILYFEDRYQYY